MRSIALNIGFAVRTINDWRKSNKAFDDRYRDAMLEGCHSLLDETISIADDLNEDAASRKVRCWARHELVKRKRPDVFSDKVDLNHGGQPGNPIAMLIAEVSGNSILPVEDDPE